MSNHSARHHKKVAAHTHGVRHSRRTKAAGGRKHAAPRNWANGQKSVAAAAPAEEESSNPKAAVPLGLIGVFDVGPERATDAVLVDFVLDDEGDGASEIGDLEFWGEE